MKKALAITALIASLAVPLTGCQNLVQDDKVCTVTDKDRSTKSDKGNSSSVFRVYTAECDTLGIADNFLQGNYNSSDLYGKIQVGHKYKFHTVGTRNGFFSWFPEITKLEEIK